MTLSANCTCWNCRAFQLETTSSLRAVAATILNVTEDRMDRYLTRAQQYRAAKLRIYECESLCRQC
ncbi:hypothetical protein ACLK1S_00565 [Escherichia coli]